MLTTILASARTAIKKSPRVALLALALTSGLASHPAMASEDTMAGTVQAFTQDKAKFNWESATLKYKGTDVVYNFGGKSKLVLDIPKGEKAGFMVTDMPKNPNGQTVLSRHFSVLLRAVGERPDKEVTVRFWLAPDLSHPDKIQVVDMTPEQVSCTPDDLGPLWSFTVYRTSLQQKIQGVCNIKKITVFVNASKDREITVNGAMFDYEYPGMNRTTRPGNVVLTNAGPLAFKSPSDK